MLKAHSLPLRRLLALLMITLAPLLLGAAGHSGHQIEHGYGKSRQSVSLPEVLLRNQQGEPVSLASLLDPERPALVQFIFTSCQTVCPVLTAMTAQAQDRLRELAPATRILSISIDPEQDTPARLRDYAKKHGSRGDWQFLTGSQSDILRVMKAFGALYEGGNKMYHKPYTFLRRAGDEDWTLLRGLFSARELVTEYRMTLEAPGS